MIADSDFCCPACRSTTAAPLGRKNGFSLWRCITCKTAYVAPMPARSILQDHYEGYSTTTKYVRKRDKKVARAMGRIKRLPLRGSLDFLDIGCNIGTAVAAALRLNMNAHGIDIDPVAIEEARRWLSPERFSVATVEEYADQGGQADVVYMADVLEHISAPESTVAALARIVRPGGLLFITCPDPEHIRRPRQFLAWREVKPPRHLVFYSRKGLRTLFGRHGFGPIRFYLHSKPAHRMIAHRV